ncbi:hypothetical protein [Streptomyces sp. H23]|nr:hypothetical protein [Streptomyces sp. H23]
MHDTRRCHHMVQTFPDTLAAANDYSCYTLTDVTCPTRTRA